MNYFFLKNVWRYYILSCSLTCILIPHAAGSGKFSFKILQYDNPECLDVNGDCCDGIRIFPYGCMVDCCDHQFTVRVQSQSDNGVTDHTAHKVKEDATSEVFGKHPVTFSFIEWPVDGKLAVNIKVDDVDRNVFTGQQTYQLVDTLSDTVDLPGAGISVLIHLIGQKKLSPTRLKASLSVTCDSHYYGPTCSKLCVPDELCSCDSDGIQQCLAEEEVLPCFPPTPSPTDCSIFREDDFINGEWHGVYSCPNAAQDNRNITFVLNTSPLASTIGISASFAVQVHNILMRGTYASFLKDIQLYSRYFDAKEVHSPVQAWGFVHMNMKGHLVSNRRVVGDMIFENTVCMDIVCPMEMVRVQSAFEKTCETTSTTTTSSTATTPSTSTTTPTTTTTTSPTTSTSTSTTTTSTTPTTTSTTTTILTTTTPTTTTTPSTSTSKTTSTTLSTATPTTTTPTTTSTTTTTPSTTTTTPSTTTTKSTSTTTPTTTTTTPTTTTTTTPTSTTTTTTSTTTPSTTTTTTTPTTTTTSTITTKTPTTTTVRPCMDNCTGHYYCRPDGSKKCYDGWTGPDCDQLISDSVADCSVFDYESDFIPSEWNGTYTCDDENRTYSYVLNISHSGTGTNGFLVLSGISIPVRGTYASYSKLLFMQSQQLLSVLVYGNNLTIVAVNMNFNTSLYMVGVIGLTTDVGTKDCVSELRRTAAYFDGCNFHGDCFRSGRRKNQFSCCCSPGYSGNHCEIPPTTTSTSTTTTTTPTTSTTTTTPTSTTTSTTTTTPTTTSTTTTTTPTTSTTTPTTTTTTSTTSTTTPTTSTRTTTTPTTTTPTTTASTTTTTSTPTTLTTTTSTTTTTETTTLSTTTSVPCKPVINCSAHYTCNPNGSKRCVDGWTGPNCDRLIPDSVADCTSFYHDEFLPSRWNGTFNCSSDAVIHLYELEVVKSTSSIDISGYLYVQNFTLHITGAYASAVHFLTLQSRDTVVTSIYGQNFTGVEINVFKRSGSFMEGSILFKNGGPRKTKCSTELRRYAVHFSGCNYQGDCYRYGTNRNDFSCCCYPGYYGKHCENHYTTTTPTTTTTPSTTTSTTTPTTTTTSRTTTTTPTTTTTITTTPTTTTTTTPTTTTTTTTPTRTTTPTTTTTTATTTTTPTTTTTTPTTTTTTPTTTTTTPTTTTPSCIPIYLDYFTPGSIYSLYMELVEEEYDDSKVREIINLAWLDSNIDLLRCGMSVFDVRVISHSPMINEEGLDIMEVKYRIMLNGTTVDQSKLRRPSPHQFDAAFQSRYHSKLYHGNSTGLVPLEYGFSFMVEGACRTPEEIKIMESALCGFWATNTSMADFNCTTGHSVLLLKQEKYYGLESLETRKFYYFVYSNGTLVHPSAVTAPDTVVIETRLKQRLPILVMYDGSLKIRYRFHYNLFISGAVFEEDRASLTLAIHDIWKDSVTECEPGQCVIQIMRLEPYLLNNDEQAYSIEYTVHIGTDLWSPVVISAPKATTFWSRLSVTSSISGQRYQVLIPGPSDSLYRSRSLWSIYFNGMVDPRDQVEGIREIRAALKAFNPGFSHDLVLNRVVPSLNLAGSYVSGLTFSLHDSNGIIDSCCISMATQKWLFDWFNSPSHQMMRGNGVPYTIYRPDIEGTIYPQTGLFAIGIEGYVIMEDEGSMRGLVEAAWDSIAIDTHVTMVREITSVADTSDVATTIFYIVTHNGVVLDMRDHYLLSLKAHEYIRPRLSNTAQFNRAYSMVDYSSQTYYVQEFLYRLRFEKQIAFGDFEKLEDALENALRISWTDYTYYQENFKVKIIKQEQVYLDKRAVYEISFILTSKRTASALYGAIFPDFVQSITEQLLTSSFTMTGIGGYKYQLYVEGYMSQFYRTFAYSLTLTHSVYQSDWTVIQNNLKNFWCIHLGGGNCGVNIFVKDQEHIVDDQGDSYWRIIYFVTVNTAIWNPARHINWTVPLYSVSSVYGFNYEVINGVDGYLYQSLYKLYTNTSITQYSTEVGQALAAAMYQTIHGNLWSSISIKVINERALHKTSSGWVWQILYGIFYNGQLLDSRTLPTLDLALLQSQLYSGVPLHFLSPASFNMDHVFYLYLQNKVSWLNYYKYEWALKQSWLQVFRSGCESCVSVHIKSQDRIVDEHGATHWQLNYEILVNGTMVDPLTVTPLSYTLLSQKLDQQVGHGNYFLSPDLAFNFNLVPWQYYTGLFTYEWIAPWQYQTFIDLLVQYYQAKYTGLRVEIGSLPLERYLYIGQYIWYFPYYVKVDDKLIHPTLLPSIGWDLFSADLHITSTEGARYQILYGLQVMEPSSMFSLYLKDRIATASYGEVERALEAAWLKQHSEFRGSTVGVHVSGQEEIVDHYGRTAWHLLYSVSVNGTMLDQDRTANLNLANLQVDVTGPLGVKVQLVSAIESSQVIPSRQLMSFHVDRYVKYQDIQKIENQLRIAWAKTLNNSDHFGGVVGIHFLRQTEYSNSKGGTIWKWEYYLTLNGSLIPANQLVADLDLIALDVAMVTDNQGHSYTVVKDASSYYDYRKHFSIYVATKVAENDLKLFEQKVVSAWRQKMSGANVEGLSQQELIDSHGKSVWELVYFVTNTHAHETLDARDTVGIDITSLRAMLSPSGSPYRILTPTAMYRRYEIQAFSVFLKNKLDKATEGKFEDTLKMEIERANRDLSGKVIVQFSHFEEYITEAGEILWKTVYFVEINNQYVPVMSLSPLNESLLNTSLSKFTGLHNQAYRVVSITGQLVYRYRDSFHVLLESKLSSAQFSLGESFLVQAWRDTVPDYNRCNCIKAHILGVEEVIDSEGHTFWQVNYILMKNNVTVESMTSLPVSLTSLQNSVTSAGYDIMVVKDTKLTVRLALAFSFYLDQDVNVNLKNTDAGRRLIKKFTSAIEATWKNKVTAFTWSTDPKVDIKRSMKYIALRSRGTLWRLEYFMWDNCMTVECDQLDPDTLPAPIPSDLQRHINFTSPCNKAYTVKADATAVDFRFHFDLSLNMEVPVWDMTWFTAAVRTIWNSTRDEASYGAIKVYIPTWEQYVTADYFGASQGFTFWQLIVFIEQDGSIVDAEVESPLDRNELHKLINYTTINGKSCELVDLPTVETVQYASLFSFYTTTPIRYEDILEVQEYLESIWTTTAFLSTGVVVKIVTQEDSISSAGELVSKVSYTLHCNRVSVKPSDVQDINTSLLALSGGLSQTYQVVGASEAVEVVPYKKLFTLTFNRAPLDVDRVAVENQLQLAWRNFTQDNSLTAVIMSREKQVDSETGKIWWKLLYAVKSKGSLLDAQLVQDIPKMTLAQFITLKVTGISYKYIDSLVQNTSEACRYTELFALFVDERVSETDYSQIEAGLVTAWNNVLNGTVVQSVDILRQEEVITASGKWAIKLLYNLKTSLGKSTAMNRAPVPVKILQRDVQVTNPKGDKYVILETAGSLGVDQMFTLTLSRRTERQDEEKVKMALKQQLVLLDGYQATEFLNATIVLQEKVVSIAQGTIAWTVMYYVTNNSRLVDAILNPALSPKDLETKIICQTGSQYKVYSASSGTRGYRKYRDMFSVNLHGQTLRSVTNQAADVLKKTWEKMLNRSDIQIESFRREEYIGDNEMTVTQLRYFVIHGNSLLYPSLTVAPSPNDIIQTSVTMFGYQPQVYKGTQLWSYDSCYRVMVYDNIDPVNRTEVLKIIGTSWQAAHADILMTVEVVKQEKYIGTYGIPLTGLLYTVSVAGSQVEPDYIRAPVNQASPGTNSIREYTSDVAYRVPDLHHIKISGKLDRAVIGKLEQTLAGLAKNVSEGAVKVNVVGSRELLNMENRDIVTELLYTVNAKNGPVLAWEVDPLPLDNLTAAILQDFGSGLEVYTSATHVLETLYMSGSVSAIYNITSAIVTAYAHTNKVNRNDITVLAMDDKLSSYVNGNWEPVSRINYAIRIKNMANNVIKKPTQTDISKVSLVKTCDCQGKKLHKLYLKGAKSSLDYPAITEALKSSWVASNNDFRNSSLRITIKPENHRRKRDASLLSDRYTLVDDKRNELTPLEFSLAIDGVEPNEMLTAPPSEDMLDQNLQATSTSTCHCVPRAEGQVTLEGKTNKPDLAKIKQAVHEAVQKENPGLLQGDSDVEIVDIAPSQQDGSDVSVVTYQVVCKNSSCDAESLTPPNKTVLAETLGHVGRTLHQTAEKIETEDDGLPVWVLPVAIAGGVLVLVLLVAVVCVVTNKRKQHKTRDLQQQGEEHPISPSVPAAIIVENPTYGFEADVGYQADVEHPTFDVDLEMDTDAQVEAEAHVGIKDYRL